MACNIELELKMGHQDYKGYMISRLQLNLLKCDIPEDREELLIIY